ncbi:MogA/MoaB family molybdenum cofactor biosynthesis protein [Corynebacterium freneyi]|uniref:Molybdenum cofactor synthesis domain-containing protein n=1 Tax=Corynebacterium freneyi TaxID=134034 RepID=A0ABS4U9G5_9CORY|nr:MogA/MoaB family molybdenum cofactor biosynthesis protein [Corynebacterium freneyi]MBP2333181.1 molybdenum cofactor synthesis domain-containing protein [Corynebacterium freneyi]
MNEMHSAHSQNSNRTEGDGSPASGAHGNSGNGAGAGSDGIVEKQLAPMEGEVPGVVITVSDRCAAGTRPDKSGPRAVEALAAHGVVCPEPVVVTDDVPEIRAAIETALNGGARLVFTTGGTGVTPRDNTPEATEPFVATRLPGLETQILNHGLTKTPLAGLSRGIVGVTGRGGDAAVIVNAPGSSGGVRDAIEVIGPLMPHLLEQLGGGDH